MAERDEFDRIVEHLDLDLDFGFEEQPAPPTGRVPAAGKPDEEFYRVVPPARLRPTGRALWAWLGVMVAPAALVLSALLRWHVGIGVVIVVTGVSAAAATYLIWRLPSHGPSQQDWPDDGAEL